MRAGRGPSMDRPVVVRPGRCATSAARRRAWVPIAYPHDGRRDRAEAEPIPTPRGRECGRPRRRSRTTIVLSWTRHTPRGPSGPPARGARSRQRRIVRVHERAQWAHRRTPPSHRQPGAGRSERQHHRPPDGETGRRSRLPTDPRGGFANPSGTTEPGRLHRDRDGHPRGGARLRPPREVQSSSRGRRGRRPLRSGRRDPIQGSARRIDHGTEERHDGRAGRARPNANRARRTRSTWNLLRTTWTRAAPGSVVVSQGAPFNRVR
jgi:hypothetical protein